MFGLGKPRTKLGRFIDQKGISQGELAAACGKSRNTISELCDGSKDIQPNEGTQISIVGALRRMGYGVSPEDFWPD